MTALLRRAQAARTAALNDAFRQQLPFPQGGRLVLTAGVAALPADRLMQLVQVVRTFDRFTPDNDPYGEHDAAVLEHGGDRFIWKIDYYENAECGFGAEDSRECYRVLTLMFAQEY